jgi:hypothetical protein
MAVDTDYALAMSDGIASVSPYGTPEPADMSPLSAPWVDLGAISTAGLVETAAETRTSFKRWGSIADFKSVITAQTKTFDINCLEGNPSVLGLFYRTPTPVPTGASVNAVQTVTITGTPTGGTFVLTFGDVATTDLPYNATPAAVQSALQALPAIGTGNVTVTGAPGGPYTVTFVGALAGQSVPQLTATSDLTGGVTPNVTVATTTAGAPGSLLSIVDDVSGKTDIRAWVFDVFEGTNHGRFYCPKAEITARKNPTYTTGAITEYGMTVTAYPDDVTGIAVSRKYLFDAVAG